MSARKVFVAKSTPITYSDVPTYKPTTDFFAALETAASTEYKTANQYQINVLPDFTPILMTILFHARRFTPDLCKVNHPKVSPFSFVAYCLNLVYAFFLVHDYELNYAHSHYATDLLVHRNFVTFYEHLQSLPVPAFLVTIFERLQQTLLDKQKTILFTPSFNGFSHYTHFGRFFPIDIFTGIHDICASFDARAQLLTNIQDFQLRTIFNVTSLNVTPLSTATDIPDYEYTHAHFFASYFPANPAAQANPQALNSKLNQMMTSLFNMKDLRAYQSRQQIVPIGLNTVTVPDARYNPYVVLMSMTANNLSELTTVYDSIASVLIETKLATVNFSSVITQSNSKILIHGYSDFPLPTWNAHFQKATPGNRPDPAFHARATTAQSPETYAANIHFLTTFNPAAPINTWIPRSNALVTLTLRAAQAVRDAISATATLSLAVRPVLPTHSNYPLDRLDAAFDDTAPLPAQVTLTYPEEPATVPTTPALVRPNNMALHDFRTFDALDSYLPRIKYYDTVDYAPSSAHLSGLAGLIIYSEELCASTVPMISSLTLCSNDNNQFLQSAIPFSLTHLAIDFKTLSPIPSRVISRLAQTALTQCCLTMFRRANVVYDNSLTRYTFDLGTQARNYGLTTVADQAIPLYNQTVIGHNVSTGTQIARNQPTRFEPPSTPAGHLLVWSPYTFVDSSLDLSNDPSAHDRLHRTHFLTNLRTLFGTTGHVYDSESIISAIPSA